MQPARRQFLHLAAGAAALPALSRFTWAQAYPTRPVRFIVPLAPGGGLDFVARLTAEHLSRSLGQQVLVENKVGAGGTIGVETAAKSPPDGYAILVTNDNVASAPHILKLSVNYLKDLVPVVQLARQALALAVHPSLGVTSLPELVSAAKQRGALGCATSGVGSNQHVLLEWFNRIAGVKLEHVPYRGAGQAINDLVAGHVPVGFLGPTALIPHYKAGTLRILAQSSEKRSASLPEIPTLQESGFDGLVLETWYGAFVPAATPPAIIARLNLEIGKALADAATRKSMFETATEPVGGSADQFGRVVQADSEKYERLAKDLKIKVE
jgi:tripartite-type tricarboxylate transporter receptor subunit TctC